MSYLISAPAGFVISMSGDPFARLIGPYDRKIHDRPHRSQKVVVINPNNGRLAHGIRILWNWTRTKFIVTNSSDAEGRASLSGVEVVIDDRMARQRVELLVDCTLECPQGRETAFVRGLWRAWKDIARPRIRRDRRFRHTNEIVVETIRRSAREYCRNLGGCAHLAPGGLPALAAFIRDGLRDTLALNVVCTARYKQPVMGEVLPRWTWEIEKRPKDGGKLFKVKIGVEVYIEKEWEGIAQAMAHRAGGLENAVQIALLNYLQHKVTFDDIFSRKTSVDIGARQIIDPILEKFGRRLSKLSITPDPDEFGGLAPVFSKYTVDRDYRGVALPFEFPFQIKIHNLEQFLRSGIFEVEEWATAELGRIAGRVLPKTSERDLVENFSEKEAKIKKDFEKQAEAIGLRVVEFKLKVDHEIKMLGLGFFLGDEKEGIEVDGLLHSRTPMRFKVQVKMRAYLAEPRAVLRLLRTSGPVKARLEAEVVRTIHAFVTRMSPYDAFVGFDNNGRDDLLEEVLLCLSSFGVRVDGEPRCERLSSDFQNYWENLRRAQESFTIDLAPAAGGERVTFEGTIRIRGTYEDGWDLFLEKQPALTEIVDFVRRQLISRLTDRTTAGLTRYDNLDFALEVAASVKELCRNEYGLEVGLVAWSRGQTVSEKGSVTHAHEVERKRRGERAVDEELLAAKKTRRGRRTSRRDEFSVLHFYAHGFDAENDEPVTEPNYSSRKPGGRD